MPQEFHVLQCFNCSTFQVDIIKKVSKWKCKMCGEKQSVKKVYFKGSGKECRLHVQERNEKRITLEPDISKLICESQSLTKNEEIVMKDKENSKWLQFMQNTETDEDEEVTNNVAESSIGTSTSKWDQYIPEKKNSYYSQEPKLNEHNPIKIDNLKRVPSDISNNINKKFKSDAKEESDSNIFDSLNLYNIDSCLEI